MAADLAEPVVAEYERAHPVDTRFSKLLGVARALANGQLGEAERARAYEVGDRYVADSRSDEEYFAAGMTWYTLLRDPAAALRLMGRPAIQLLGDDAVAEVIHRYLRR